MKLKKIGALLLAATMSVSLLTACGGNSNSASSNSGSSGTGNTASGGSSGATASDNSSGGTSSNDNSGEVEQISLKVWVPEEEMEITYELCSAFNDAHPEYDCTFDIAVIGIDESSSQLENDPELAADVFQLPSGSISQLVDAGLLYPITANIDSVKSLYGEGAIAACTRGDWMYGVPFSPNSWFMYYNTSMYTEDEVKNLDTMMAKDLGSDVYNFSCVLHDSWYLEAFFYAAGCTLFGPDGTDPTDCSWNDANGLAAGEYLIDLVNNPKYVEDRDGVAGSLMKDGKLAALCSGTWAGAELLAALGDDFGACALPTITLNGKEVHLSNFADYKCYAVKSNTAHPMAAQLLAEWLADEDSQLIRYNSESGATPTCLSLQDNPDVANDIATCALIAQTEFATPQPSISQISEYWTPVAALGDGITTGTITKDNLQQSLDKVASDITSGSLGGN